MNVPVVVNDGLSDTAQPATAASAALAGERLRQARARMGLRIEDLSARTRIRSRYFGLIEAGRLEDFASPTHAVDIACFYARLVGVSEQWVAEQIRPVAEALAERRAAEAPLAPPPPRDYRVPIQLGIATLLFIAWGAAIWFLLRKT